MPAHGTALREAAVSIALAVTLAACDGGHRSERSDTAPVAPASTQSSAIAVSGDGTSVWVVNPDSDSVGVLDATSNELGREITVGDNPRTLALRGRRHAFVAVQDSDSVSRIDMRTDEVDSVALPFGSAPYGVAPTPDGTLLVVTLERTDRVLLLDPETLGVRSTIAVARTPRGIAVSADGKLAFVIRVGPIGQSTFYSRWGDVFAWGCLLCLTRDRFRRAARSS